MRRPSGCSMPSLASALLSSLVPCRPPKRGPQEGLDEQLARAFTDSEGSRGERQRGRYATSATVAERRQWQTALLELREARQASGHKHLGAALSEFIWRQWPATQKNKREFERVRKMCYNLLASASSPQNAASRACVVAPASGAGSLVAAESPWPWTSALSFFNGS